MNIAYPDGSGCLYVGEQRYQIDSGTVQRLRACGVAFFEFKKKVASHIKVCSVYEVITPDGVVIHVQNMKAFAEANFDRSYTWILRRLVTPEGYNGYRARKMYEAVVQPGADSYIVTTLPVQPEQNLQPLLPHPLLGWQVD